MQNMATLEIERDDWKPFLDSFSRRHEGWLVTVEVLAPELGDQIAIDNLPLCGITTETTGDDSIEITVIGQGDQHLTHTVDAPREVWLKQTDRGADEVLEVASGATVTLVRFRSAMRPEEVDGLPS